jgi:hypothetical protein
MNKSAIRLLTLATFAIASATAPMIAPAKAATDGSTPAKKKHKKLSPAGGQIQNPTASSQIPRNLSDDLDRKGGGY